MGLRRRLRTLQPAYLHLPSLLIPSLFFLLFSLLTFMIASRAGISSLRVSLQGVLIHGLVIWLWFTHLRDRPESKTLLYRLAALILAVPLILWAAKSIQIIHHTTQLKRIASTTEVSAVKLNLIQWPGLKKPVGLKIQITLQHPKVDAGYVVFPKVAKVFLNEETPDKSNLVFSQAVNDFYLSVPLRSKNRIHELPLSQSTQTSFEFDLYPHFIHSIIDQKQVCLNRYDLLHAADMDDMDAELDDLISLQEKEAQGAQAIVMAEWYLDIAQANLVDLGKKLSAEVTQKGAQTLTNESWFSIFRALLPKQLLASGFKSCRVPDVKGNSSLDCYCRGA